MSYTGYRSIHYNPRKGKYTLWTWDKHTGERIVFEKTFEPYLYVESDLHKDAVSIYNTTLRKIEFPNTFERNKFVRQGGSKRLFYNIPIEQQILIDEFKDKNHLDEFSQFPLKIFSLDIETYSPNEFPEPSLAKDPIVLITLHDSIDNIYHTWGLGNDYHSTRDNVKYYKCVSETDLLRSFVRFWRKDFPDVLTTWNGEGFDVPYIINRLNNVLGDGYAEKLSPVGEIFKRDNVVQQFGKMGSKWYIKGVNCIDYLDTYKTFNREKREAYNLNYIGQIELGLGKLTTTANLSDLSQNDWNTFVEYNIQDVEIVVELERKKQYIMLVRMLAYMGLTNLDAALGTVSIVTGALALQALKRGLIIPTFTGITKENYAGGFVQKPVKGLHECVLSFDANSLYPNTIITLNISPETKVGKIINSTSDGVEINLINGKTHKLTLSQFGEFIKKEQIAISKAGVMYSQKHKGFCPELLEKIYADRVANKKMLKDHKRALSHCKQGSDKWKEHTDAANKLDIMQYTLKILMNRLYGTFANEYSPFCDIDAAGSITLTGQSVIKEASNICSRFAKKYNVESNINIYGDTDSVYFSLKDILQKENINLIENGHITKKAYDLFEQFENYLNEEITQWATRTLNTIDSRFVFKREAICDVGLFFESKKRYILHILDEEGVPCDKMKYTGVEIASTSISNKVKPLIENIINAIFKTKNYHETQKAYRDAFDKFSHLSVEDLAWPRSIRNLEKYESKATGLSTGKGTPRHCKAVIYYNHLLDELQLTHKYAKIKSGDKIKFFNTEKNKYGIDCIAFNGIYPPEFNINADYKKMFQIIVYAAIERLYDALGWTAVDLDEEPVNNLLDLLS